MDILAITTALDLGKKALEVVKQVKDFLPNNTKRHAAEQTLKEADNAFKLAEVQVAKELGYYICKCTWPPQISISIGYEGYDEKFKCPKCDTIWPSEMPPL